MFKKQLRYIGNNDLFKNTKCSFEVWNKQSRKMSTCGMITKSRALFQVGNNYLCKECAEMAVAMGYDLPHHQISSLYFKSVNEVLKYFNYKD